jgi:acetyl-CoA synthetase (ADP-forming)
MWRYRDQIQSRPEGTVRSFTTDDDTVSGIIDAAMARGASKLSEPDALHVLEAYDIPVTPWAYVESGKSMAGLARETAAAAAALGYPVALKVVSPTIVHKTDVGGVVLDLDDDAAVERAVRKMLKAIADPVDGMLVQRMAAKGRETIVGITRMSGVGPMVMFGLGGVYVEVLKDVVLRLAPLRDTDAAQMIREVKMIKLLEGVRGEPARDLAAIADVLLRASQLAERHPRISEMDINPLLALEDGVVAVDARFAVAPA